MTLSERQMNDPDFWKVHFRVERFFDAIATDLDLDLDDILPVPGETIDRVTAFFLRGMIEKRRKAKR